jgi:DNA (cytosine-5)-methyltransferase 1
MTPSFFFYEFFAGAGLVRLALSPTWQPIWANDISPKKQEVYVRNFGNNEFVLGDVAQVRASDLPGRAHMAWASFPCEDLSLAGWRCGMAAERSGTFWAFWRIMRDLHESGRRPPLLALENVPGLLYGDNFRGLCEALAALEMNFGALVIDAQHFLPQSRPRVFIVAVDHRVPAKDLTCDQPPASLWAPGSLIKAYSSLPGDLQRLWRWWRLPVPPERRVTLADLIADEPLGVKWNSEEETQYLLSLMNERNLAKVRNAQQAGGRWVFTVYRRMRYGKQRAEVRDDGIAGCLRTPRGGSSRQTLLVIEHGRVRSRLLSPREAARLMGVPDCFWLPDRYNDAYYAVGDGVAVPVVRWLGEHLLTPLAERAAMLHGLQPNGTPSRRAFIAYRLSAERWASRWEAARRVGSKP